MNSAASRQPEEALRACIDALHGEKAVGHILKPETDAVLAGQWLAHCLDPERREKLSLDQIALIFRLAKQAGRHEGFEHFAASVGYCVVAVISPKDEIAQMAREVESHAKAVAELSLEVAERMRHSNIRIDE